MEGIDEAKNVVLRLTGLEIFFIITTLISIGFNFYQFVESRSMKKELHIPIYSALVGLFNDIKLKRLNAYLQQSYVASDRNPHTELNTIKWEYQQFCLSVATSMQGFQETVTAILLTLNPKDKEGKEVFSASNFGLSDTERLIRDQNIRQYLKPNAPLDPEANESQ